jgi:uncharacterized membrane protein
MINRGYNVKIISAILLIMLACVTTPKAELIIEKVFPEKLYCRPGEVQGLELMIFNPDRGIQDAHLKMELRHDLDTIIPLMECDITVQPGKRYVWNWTWVAKPLLGVEFRVILSRDGIPFAEKRNFFTCARSVHQVLLVGKGDHSGWQFSGRIDKEKYPLAWAMDQRTTYGNYCEKFAWAPSDFDDLTPETDRWWAGQTAYNESKPNMLAMIQAMHNKGIQVITYGKASGGGPVGYELLRKRPDLAGYTDGRFWGNYNAAGLDYLSALDPPKENEQRMVPDTPDEMQKGGYTGVGWFAPFTKGYDWCDVWYSSVNPEVANIGIGELVGSAKMFGFDGVRFDGEFFASRNQQLDGSFNAPENFNSSEANLQLVKKMKEECWNTKSGYLFGYNAGTDITWSVSADNVPSEFREKCKDDGLIANEMMAFPGDIPWLEYAEKVRRESDLVRHYGGHHATYAFNRSADRLYNLIVQYAMRSHCMNSYAGTDVELNKFATRFARFLWDDEIKGWADAPKSVDVTADREVWWKPFTAFRPAPDGGTQFIIHVINPPEGKTTLSDQKLPNAPAKDVKIRWKEIEGFKRAVLVDLSTCDFQVLTPKKETDAFVFTVPEVKNWAIVVVETDTKPPVFEQEAVKVTSPSSALSAQELGLAPQTHSQQSWRIVIEPEQWGGGESTADRVKDIDASSGGACMGQPGRPEDSMAYTYGYPRIPAKYKATYRLKVADNTVDKPVFSLNVDDFTFHPIRGVPKLENPTLIVKATDFAKPNIYQDFTILFEHADQGFLGVGCRYLGGVNGWWDKVTLELVEPWSKERLIEHYKGFAPPDNLELKRDDTLDVLLIRGLFNKQYRLDDAVSKIAEAKATTAYTTYHPQHDTQLAGYQLDWEPLFKQDAMVLANVEARGLGLGQVRMIGEWVKQGGGLVILGGLVTLGQNWNMERGWTDLLPVELNSPWEIKTCDPPIAFAKPSVDSPFANISWESSPVVLYRHNVKAKPNTTVLLSDENGESLMIGQSVGKGRVVVFTGTVLGESPEGKTAFWNITCWQDILAKAILWSAGK